MVKSIYLKSFCNFGLKNLPRKGAKFARKNIMMF